MCEIRGGECLLAGLCHPSQELRDRVLSKMKLFRVPPDPFAKTDGTVEQLKNVVEDCECKWHKRSAAIVSVVQISQIDHCQEGTIRKDTLQWVLDLLSASADKHIYFALVTSLGMCLKGIANHQAETGCIMLALDAEKPTHEAGAECIMLEIPDEQQVLGCLNFTLDFMKRKDIEKSVRGLSEALDTERSIRGLSEALADLRAYSEGRMDWILDKLLTAKGEWPLRHVLLLCELEKAAASADSGRATRLCWQLLQRVHDASIAVFQSEHEHVLKGLDTILAVIGLEAPSAVLHFLEHGEAHQRVRVLCVAAELNVQFARPTLIDLARALLSHEVAGTKINSLLSHFLQHEYAQRRSKLVHEHTSLGKVSRVVYYLQDVIEPSLLRAATSRCGAKGFSDQI